MPVLSVFPGIDLLGRGFEQEGFCVVRGPDLLFGGDIMQFHTSPGWAQGVIGGSPCQDFSTLRRVPPSGDGLRMLGEFRRVVLEALPDWFLLENVPAVPDMFIDGYTLQRLDVRASECGLTQERLRHFQFGSRFGRVLVLDRPAAVVVTDQAALASEGSQQGRRSWADFCALQGLPAGFNLPGMTRAARYRAVGNGVPVPMAAFMARAIRDYLVSPLFVRLCACGCGRSVKGKQRAALPACRKRLERRRRAVTGRQLSMLDGSQV